MNPIRLAVIGGSGLYQMKGLEILEERKISTPFGDPSDALILGRLQGIPVVFLPRHGRGHRILPSELNFRANIWALKSLGVEYILSFSAVGSLSEKVEPGHLVMVDQFIDRTQGRASTFFGEGIVAHVAFGDPTCYQLRHLLHETALSLGATSHLSGTYLCMEGPIFSTKAESHLYRSWGAHVIGMTNLQEAKLAREAGISYATVALSTDYDCWHPEHDQVSVEMILATLENNALLAQNLIAQALPKMAELGPSPYQDVLKHAILTNPKMVPEVVLKNLALILPKNYCP
ncbi:MAG: S-methyl-5'-thioadenosine phosphorylase [Deltaproteobacteria bacterium]|nr:S-methyl-5'-thioadenosine phosphorylase [Deltaproteobacteria bacterium]